MNDRLYDFINDRYNDITYLEKYGGSVFMSLITLFIFFMLYSYLRLQIERKYYQSTWNKNKCSPAIIPLAGEISAKEGESKLLFSANNFMECNKNIMTNIVQSAVSPLFYSTQLFTNLLLQVGKSVNAMRILLKGIITFVSGIANWIYTKLVLILLPIKIMLINIQSMNNKFAAILTVILYNIMDIYNSIRSLFSLIVKILVLILGLMIGALIATAAIAGFWNPFAWILFAIMLIAFIIWYKKAGYIILKLVKLFAVMSPNIPPRRSKSSFLNCFDSNTLINTVNGHIPIQHIKVGDKLDNNNNYVTSIMQLIHNDDMYILDGIKVTASHKVLYGNKYINVSEHPNSTLLDNYNNNNKYVYCINTSNKVIHINNHTFLDWDEITNMDIDMLYKNKYFDTKESINIHKYLDTGFHANTKVYMHDGTYQHISNINIDDILHNNNRVMGIVKVLANDIHTYKQYNIDNKIIYGSNLNVKSNDINTLKDVINNNNMPAKIPTYIYNLITYHNTIRINDNDYYCYDSLLYNIFENTDEYFNKQIIKKNNPKIIKKF